MTTPRLFLAVLIASCVAAAPASAADVTSVKSPKRVKAGASAKVVASVSAVTSCRLTVGRVSVLAPATGADRVTFTFTVSPKARPGRYTLTLRCGAVSKRLRMTVTARKGRRGTSGRIVKGRIRYTVRATPAGPGSRARTEPDAGRDPGGQRRDAPTGRPGPAELVPRRLRPRLRPDPNPGYVAGIVATINEVNRWFTTGRPPVA